MKKKKKAVSFVQKSTTWETPSPTIDTTSDLQKPVEKEEVKIESVDPFELAKAETTSEESQPAKEKSESKRHEDQEKLDQLMTEAKRLVDRDPASHERKLVEWLSLAPQDMGFLSMLTDHYFQTGEHKKALSLLKRILDQDKDNHKALRQMWEIYLAQWDVQTAEIMIEKAVKRSKDNPKYLYSLVDIKYNTNSIDDAIFLVEKILKLRPSNVEYLTAAAMLYEAHWDKVKAKKYFFEILQHDPENRVAKKKLIQYK